MKTKRVTRYISDCGRGFWSKNTCLEHEKNCKCWTNPAFRTCKTCEFAHEFDDSNGMEHEPQFLHTWRQIECKNPAFDYETHFNQAHENAPYLCVNCTQWKYKKGEWNGGIKVWEINGIKKAVDEETQVFENGLPF